MATSSALLSRPVDEVALADFIQRYGYKQADRGCRLPRWRHLSTVLRRIHRVRWFFLNFKLPPDLPDLVDPMFQRAVQTLRQDGALSKAVFMTPHADIFFRLHDAAQGWHTPRVSAWKWSSTWKGRKSSGYETGHRVCTNQAAKARFALWGQPVVTVQSLTDFLIGVPAARRGQRPPSTRGTDAVHGVDR